MKKLLYGTTALVSAGVVASSAAHAEGGIKLGLGGYMNNFFGGGDVDNDDNDFEGTGMFSDGEVWFIGQTTLDNGLTFGANIQLESFTAGDQIDENFGYMQGGFGRLQFGSENTAAYLMQYAAPSVGVPINSGWVTSFIPVPAGFTAAFRSPALSTFLDTGNDENTLTYFTPRLFGFQLGASYQAALDFSGDGKNFPVQADKDTEYKHGLAVGVNFVESFGAIDVSIAGGYRGAQAPDDDIVILNPTGGAVTNGVDPKVRSVNVTDINQVSAGLNIGYAGFTFGGSFAKEIDGRVTANTTAFGTGDFGGPALAAGVFGVAPFPAATNVLVANTYTSSTTSTKGTSFDVGLSYGTGPWTFGATYFAGEVEGNMQRPGKDKMQSAVGGVEYALGPGITSSISVLWGDWDGEDGVDNRGVVGVGGVNFRF